jgi:hypothetical protein
MVPQTYERFSAQERDAALVWGEWDIGASGAPTKRFGHNSLTLTRTNTGEYTVGWASPARVFGLVGLPLVAPSTPGANGTNHRMVIPVDPIASSADVPAVTFRTYAHAVDGSTFAAAADPQNPSTILVWALVAK